MKKLFYFIGACLIVGIITSFIFASLPVFPYLAKDFLINVANNNFERAYFYLSPEFKKKVDLQNFEKNIRELGLDQYQEANWLEDVTQPDRIHGHLKGIVLTKHSLRIPIEFDFVQYKGDSIWDRGWRIEGIHILPEQQ